MPNQLIYRQSRGEPLDIAPLPRVRFVFCANPLDGLRIGGALVRRLGAAGVAWDLLKLMTPPRRYTCLLDAGHIVSECYVTLSRCKHYDVEAGAAVLGPVWTDPARRGQGLATWLLKATINRLIACGCPVFYIDTSDQNASMLRVIVQCGFGAPVRSVPKTGAIR